MANFNLELFINNLLLLKSEKNISSKNLAIQADINYKTLSNIENQKSIPSIKTIVQILNTFGMTLQQFLKMEKPDKRPLVHKKIYAKIDGLADADIHYLIETAKALYHDGLCWPDGTAGGKTPYDAIPAAMLTDDMEYNSRKIGVKILLYRDMHGLNQQALAAKSSVSPSTIIDLERGIERAHKIDTLTKIATALDVTIDELIYDNLVANIDFLKTATPLIHALYDCLLLLSDEKLQVFYRLLEIFIGYKKILAANTASDKA